MYNLTQIVYFFTQQLVSSYVSQCCVNFLNSGLTVYDAVPASVNSTGPTHSFESEKHAGLQTRKIIYTHLRFRKRVPKCVQFAPLKQHTVKARLFCRGWHSFFHRLWFRGASDNFSPCSVTIIIVYKHTMIYDFDSKQHPGPAEQYYLPYVML